MLGAFERDGRDLAAIEVLGKDAARDSVAVKADDQVEQRRAIGHHDALVHGLGDMQLLGIVQRVADALVIAQARVGRQVGKGDALKVRQRAVAADEYVRLRTEQRHEVQVGRLHHVRDDAFVEVAAVQHAQLAALHPHVVDDAGGGRLPQREFVAVAVVFAHERDERVHYEGVMLGGNAEHAADAIGALVFAFQKVGLLDDLTGAREEAHALFGRDDAGARTREDGDVHFAFKFRHRLGKAGLRDEELLRRRGERPGFGYLDDVSELLKFHGPYSSRKGRRPVGYSRVDPRRGGVARGIVVALRAGFAVVPRAGVRRCVAIGSSRPFPYALGMRKLRGACGLGARYAYHGNVFEALTRPCAAASGKEAK